MKRHLAVDAATDSAFLLAPLLLRREEKMMKRA
jgi:hypothetical protein